MNAQGIDPRHRQHIAAIGAVMARASRGQSALTPLIFSLKTLTAPAALRASTCPA